MVFDYDIFLSHHPDDRPVAQALAQRLRNDGLKVTWDETHLEQTRCFIACLSPGYVTSTWATLEVQTLRFRDPSNQACRFIPLLLADCTPPATIAQFAHIDWLTSPDNAYNE